MFIAFETGLRLIPDCQPAGPIIPALNGSPAQKSAVSVPPPPSRRWKRASPNSWHFACAVQVRTSVDEGDKHSAIRGPVEHLPCPSGAFSFASSSPPQTGSTGKSLCQRGTACAGQKETGCRSSSGKAAQVYLTLHGARAGGITESRAFLPALLARPVH